RASAGALAARSRITPASVSLVAQRPQAMAAGWLSGAMRTSAMSTDVRPDTEMSQYIGYATPSAASICQPVAGMETATACGLSSFMESTSSMDLTTSWARDDKCPLMYAFVLRARAFIWSRLIRPKLVHLLSRMTPTYHPPDHP